MSPALLAKLREATEQVSRGAHGRTLALPRGVAARVDAADLRALLDDHEALLVAAQRVLDVLDVLGSRPQSSLNITFADLDEIRPLRELLATFRGGA